MAVTHEELDQYTQRLSGLHEKLKPEDLYAKKEALEKETTDPGLWQDEAKAKSLLQELARLQSLLADLTSVSDNLKSLADLIKLAEESKDSSLDSDLESLHRTVIRQLDRLELATYLSGPYDKNEAILSIHSGQGGTEAMDWATMLSRMYTRYFERKDWPY